MITESDLELSDEFIRMLINNEFLIKLGNICEIRPYNDSFDHLSYIIEAWEDISSISNMTYYNDNGNVTVSADWSSVAKVVTSTARELIDNPDIWYSDMISKHDLVVTVSSDYINGIPDNIKYRRNYAYYIELYLYNAFLVMNLSAPGSLVLYGTTFNAMIDPLFMKNIHLHSNVFSNAHMVSTIRDWPQISYIPVSDISNWLSSFDINTKQFSTSRIEKVIFALFHLSISDDTFSTLIWSTYIIETLYDTPFSAIKKMLIDRISLVLGEPTRKTRKMIGEFYDLRSSFLHGRMQIPHPLYNDILDPNAANDYKELAHYNDLACSIIISTLQYHIRNNYKELRFNESFNGIA